MAKYNHWNNYSKFAKWRKWARRMLIARDGCVCGVCHKEIAKMRQVSLDHVIPRSRGGSDDISNLQLAHKDCNRDKADMTPEEWKEFQYGSLDSD